jgi:hypothetical protein
VPSAIPLPLYGIATGCNEIGPWGCLTMIGLKRVPNINPVTLLSPYERKAQRDSVCPRKVSIRFDFAPE